MAYARLVTFDETCRDETGVEGRDETVETRTRPESPPPRLHAEKMEKMDFYFKKLSNAKFNC